MRPSQDVALRLAQYCEPVSAVVSPTDSHLRQSTYAAGANVAEVLYDAGGASAVLHACPQGFDAFGGTYESVDAAGTGGGDLAGLVGTLAEVRQVAQCVSSSSTRSSMPEPSGRSIRGRGRAGRWIGRPA